MTHAGVLPPQGAIPATRPDAADAPLSPPARAGGHVAENIERPSRLVYPGAGNFCPRRSLVPHAGRDFSLPEVAQLLKVAEKTVYTMAQRSELPAFKVRGQWRFKRADIDAWIEQQKAASRDDGSSE